MEIIGRIVRDATVRTIKKNDRKVVSFTIAINDYYKPKDTQKGIAVTTYIDCAYWINPGLASYLAQGALIEVHGRIYATAYNNKNGEAKAAINCHVNAIKIHSRTSIQKGVKEGSEEVKEDLPF